MGAVEEEGWNKFIETVDWASPLDVCANVVGLVGEWAPEEYEYVKSSDNDDEVVMYTPEGQHARTKSKVMCTRAMSKFVRTKMG